MQFGLEAIIATITAAWLGSTEWRLRTMQNKLAETATRKETQELIDLKQEALKALQREIKEDIQRVEQKIDRLIERQSD